MSGTGVGLILPAAGRSTRMGRDKLWIDAAGGPVIGHTLAAVAAAGGFDVVVVATDPANWLAVRALAAAAGLPGACLLLVEGGARRQHSVARGLAACRDVEVVAVHDAARPLAAPGLFTAAVAAARAHGAATTAVPVIDSIKRVDAFGRVVESLERAELVVVQTPQAFRADLLRRAHLEAARLGLQVDDDCALVEALGELVVTVPGDPVNIKVTRPADVAVLEAALRQFGARP